VAKIIKLIKQILEEKIKHTRVLGFPAGRKGLYRVFLCPLTPLKP
jgi:hypothetical protein